MVFFCCTKHIGEGLLFIYRNNKWNLHKIHWKLIVVFHTSIEREAEAVMNFMLTKEAQQILLDSMAAIPVIDSSNLSSDNSKYLKDLKIDSFRTASIGNLGTELNEEWDQKIGTLNK